MNPFDVSIVLNVHREAIYLRPTLLSLSACASEAVKAGLRVELIAVFDRPDNETKKVFSGTQLHGFDALQTAEIDAGSLGLARNAGIALAKGEYIWTSDSDDLVSSNALVQLVATARDNQDRKPAVFVEFYVGFGDRFHVARFFDDDWLTAADFAFQHSYVSRILLHREAFDKFLYRDLSPRTGFAYEDWDFSNRLLAAGYSFVIAPETAIFYRQRQNSLLMESDSVPSRATLHSSLFEPHYFRAFMAEARRRHVNWESFIDRRQALHRMNFASKMLASESMKQQIIEAARLDPEIDPCRIEKAESYCPVPSIGNHWGFQLDVFYGLAGSGCFTDVVVLPWLRPGGAEKYILQILSELRKQGIAKKILVLTGEQADQHEWLSRLPGDAVLIDLYNLFPLLDTPARLALAHRAILALSDPGARLHLKPSHFAHQLMECYGKTLSSHMETIYYRFCDHTYTWRGLTVRDPWSVRHLRSQALHIHKLVSDCEFIRADDKRSIAVLESKHHVVYAACDVLKVERRPKAPPVKRLLWASRVSVQKRPQLLVTMIAGLREHYSDLQIDIYGAIEPPYDSNLFEVDGLCYRGKYNEFSEIIRGHAYDAFIYTSDFDGLPNVVLEALGAGFPVIAADVGGVSEAVTDCKTGYLVRHDANDSRLATAYVHAIQRLYGHWDSVNELSASARELIRERHSAEMFTARVNEVFSKPEPE